MVTPMTNQGLTNADWWAVEQLLAKANTEQLLYLERKVTEQISIRAERGGITE
jgi:hypothetical protein